MFFCREKLCVKTLAAVFLFSIFAFVPAAEAQTRKNPKNQPAQQASAKSAPKSSASSSKDKKAVARDTKSRDAKTDKTDKEAKTAKAGKQPKPTKADLARREEERREAIERRAAEAERRQEALEAKRRREQAAREAAARRLAFERGLRTETIKNISEDDTGGEDLEARRAAIAALGTHAGTVVVMEAQTGKILTVVNQDWGIRQSFKPCSTIKLVTGVAGLSEKLIDGGGNVRARPFPMNLDDALAYSNNSYFQVVGRNMGSRKMISYAQALGLGQPTGINADGETSGKLPFGNENPRIYSHGDDFEVSPLQLAVMVSALTNGGKVVVPQIPRTRTEKANFRGFLKREISLPAQNLLGVRPGMIGAVNYGTARRSGAADFLAAGKTGSCIGQGSWVGLFASVAPVTDPQLAVVVITRGQAERGKYASAIAGKIYRALGYRFRQNNQPREQLAKLPASVKPQPKINAQTAALLDADRDDDSDENEFTPAVRTNPKKGGDDAVVANQPGAKLPAKTDKLFPPVVIEINREPSRPRVVPMKNK